jgi:hypothetical protein
VSKVLDLKSQRKKRNAKTATDHLWELQQAILKVEQVLRELKEREKYYLRLIKEDGR